MKQLLYSGIIYLIGIAVILVIRPQLMFSTDDNDGNNNDGGGGGGGKWKEFGIGRDPNKYTWMPFWLFAIIWAILSYIIVMSITGYGSALVDNSGVSLNKLTNAVEKNKENMMPGYYILNKNASAKKGIPKYIYLGEEPPNLVYSPGEE